MTFKRKLLQALAATTFTGLAGAAHAHFQMLYVEETALQRAENLEFALVFTHPFSGGPTMAMNCLLYTSPSPRDRQKSRMPSSA